jgi:hypothetical protein
MTVDAAASRAAARVLRRAYNRTVRTMRREHHLDVVVHLTRRDRGETVGIVVQDMTANLIGYLLVALFLAAPVVVVSTAIHPWVVRYVVTACALVPAAVPLGAMATLAWWQIATALRSRRTEWPRLSQHDVERLVERGGVAAWRVAFVLGLLAAIGISAVPPP